MKIRHYWIMRIQSIVLKMRYLLTIVTSKSLQMCHKLKDNSAEQIASSLMKLFREETVEANIEYFRDLGFTASNMEKDKDVLFRFLVLLSYDRQPFSVYEAVWERGNPQSIFSVLDDQSLLDLNGVRALSDKELRRKLENAKARGYILAYTSPSGVGTDYAKMFRELSLKIDEIAVKLKEVRTGADAEKLFDKIMEVHGFGNVLTAKFILFVIREMGIGAVPSEDLGSIASHIHGERHNRGFIKMMNDPSRGGREGLFRDVLSHMREDPMAFDYVFGLHREYCQKGACDDCPL